MRDMVALAILIVAAAATEALAPVEQGAPPIADAPAAAETIRMFDGRITAESDLPTTGPAVFYRPGYDAEDFGFGADAAPFSPR